MSYFVCAVKARGMKMRDLADAIGIGPSVLSSRIHGRTPWTLTEVQRTCKVLGMSLSEFAEYFPLKE